VAAVDHAVVVVAVVAMDLIHVDRAMRLDHALDAVAPVAPVVDLVEAVAVAVDLHAESVKS